MMHSENDEIVSEETAIADTMNKYFVNITRKLKLKPTETEINEFSLSEILDKYKDHQSIVKYNLKWMAKIIYVTYEEALKNTYSLKAIKDY